MAPQEAGAAPTHEVADVAREGRHGETCAHLRLEPQRVAAAALAEEHVDGRHTVLWAWRAATMRMGLPLILPLPVRACISALLLTSWISGIHSFDVYTTMAGKVLPCMARRL